MEKEKPKEIIKLSNEQVIDKTRQIITLFNKLAYNKGYFKRGFGWDYEGFNIEDTAISISVALYYYSYYFGSNAKITRMALTIDKGRITKVSYDTIRGYWATQTMKRYSQQLKDLREDLYSLNINHIFKGRESKWK